MFLFKRKGIYYLEYFDEIENRKRRISTRKKKKPEALKFLSEFKEQLVKSQRVKYISLKQFKEEFLEYTKRTKSNSYYRLFETSFNVLFKELGDVPLNKITPKELESLLIREFNRTKYGANHYYSNWKVAFNKATEWGYLKENPLRNIKLPKIPKKLPAFITPKELETIVQKTDSRDLKDIFRTAFHTGMRLSELINLKWNDINFNERIITVTNKKDFTTKTKTERTIPINDTLLRVLQNRFPKLIDINLNEYVFHKSPGIKYNGDYVSKKFKKVIRDLKMSENIHYHSLRHSAASNMAMKGISILLIKEILGHRDVATTQIYSSVTVDSLRNAVNVLG